MKTRNTLLAISLLVLTASGPSLAQGPGTIVKNPNPVLVGPDLITDGISYKNLGSGKIEIAVRNIGQKPSVKSLVRILITMPGETQSTGRSADVRALGPGQIQWVPIATGKQLNLVKYCLVADALNQNKETNEKNNERCGQFEGKP